MLQKQVEVFTREKVNRLKDNLLDKIRKTDNINLIAERIDADSTDMLLFLVLGASIDGKANLTVMISENLVKEKNLNAGQIIRDVSFEIDGGGGGQPFFATAGGKNVKGLEKAIQKATEWINR